MSADDTPSRPPSLFRELADGTAGPGIRLVVTLAMAATLTGLTLIAAYALAAIFPQWNRAYGNNWGASATYPRDELVAGLFVISGAVFIAITAWLWIRHARRHVMWFAIVATMVLTGVTAALAALAESLLDGEEEMVIAGIVFIGFAAAFVLWLQCYRIVVRARPARNATDGQLDLRCPTCGYRMVGLHEARCPECGTNYTLDDLLSRQNFAGVKPAPPVDRAPARV